MSALADREVNVLQAINLTLSTSAFLALADSLPKMFNPAGSPSAGRILYVALLVFWAVKLLVENHKSFAGRRVLSHPRYAVFQLVMAVAMMLALVVSAKSANDLTLSAWWLMLSLGAGVVWLIGLAIYFIAGDGFDWRKYPWVWLVSGVIIVGGSLWIAHGRLSFESYCTIAIIVVMLVAGIIDSVVMKTFSLAHIESANG